VNLSEFVDCLPHEAFFELMRACTDRMAYEISNLAYEDEPEEEEEPATTAVAPTTTKAIALPAAPITPPHRSSAARALMQVTPTRSKDVPKVELTKEEKDLARNDGYIKAIKELRNRKPELKLMQCRDVVELFMMKEGIPTPRQRREAISSA